MTVFHGFIFTFSFVPRQSVDKFTIQVAADLRAAGRRLADRVARSASSAEYRTQPPGGRLLPSVGTCRLPPLNLVDFSGCALRGVEKRFKFLSCRLPFANLGVEYPC